MVSQENLISDSSSFPCTAKCLMHFRKEMDLPEIIFKTLVTLVLFSRSEHVNNDHQNKKKTKKNKTTCLQGDKMHRCVVVIFVLSADQFGFTFLISIIPRKSLSVSKCMNANRVFPP